MHRRIYSDDVRTALESQLQPLAVFQYIDNQVSTVLVSDGFCRLFGYSDREQAVWDMDHDMYKDTHPDDKKRIADAAYNFATGDDSTEYEVVFRTRAGVDSDYHVIHAHGVHIFPETGIRLAQIWYMDEGAYVEGSESDTNGMNRVLNSILHQESILRAANYDMLTGLPNLAYFFKHCEDGKARLFKENKHGCLLYIDLNGMKYYNFRFGFAEGDKLLITIADILARIFGHEDCCHVGADRFAVSAEEDNLEEHIRQFLDEFEQAKRHLPVRVGIYSTSLEDVPVSSAYDRAKLACDTIRKSEESCFNYYTQELGAADKNRRYIQSSIDKAIAENWIQVYYQPIVRAINGRVCDEEALARWIDPEKGFLSPGEFIPYLEESGQIYKLDLYVLEQTLKKMLYQQKNGFDIVPHSINLSRSDFDACDIVEEIRKRVDASGFPRHMITIEITESVIGSSLEFMKEQIARFKELGFPVWMDDFGSGFSSLEVLQSVHFDLIKFDMSFMRRLNDGDNARIVLTDLMKMAVSLGSDTVCEGVETEEQVHFLQEIGCSKLQGFYFSKPNPLEEILNRYQTGRQIGYEETDCSDYFRAIGSIDLYDLDVITSQKEDSLKYSFNTIPVGIIEINGECARFVRFNSSYRQFMQRIFGVDLQAISQQYKEYSANFSNNVVRICRDPGSFSFFDNVLPDGSVLHAFARWVGRNPSNGNIAVIMAILSIRNPNENISIERIRSVCTQIGDHVPGGFFIYKADKSEELLYANKTVCDIFGCDSQDDFKSYTGYTFRGMVHPDDYDKVNEIIDRQISENKYEQDYMEYRIIRKDGKVRWIGDFGQYMEYNDHQGLFFVFISDTTEQHQEVESDKAKWSAVVEALTRVYDSVWFIKDLKTQQFELFRVDEKMVHLIPTQEAAKLEKYYDAFVFYSKLVLEEDRQRFLDAVTPESIQKNTENKLIYSVPFRRVFEDGIRFYRVEFARMDMGNGNINIVTAFKDMDAASN